MDDDARMRFEGRWQELRGRVKEAWGDLTDDELDKTGASGIRSLAR